MTDKLQDGFCEEIDKKRVRVWTNTTSGGYWTTMSKLRYDKEFDKSKTPFFCPVCKQAMLVDIDKQNYFKYKCCFKCCIFFVEGREERWKTGWRPSEDDMKRYYEWREQKKIFSIDKIEP